MNVMKLNLFLALMAAAPALWAAEPTSTNVADPPKEAVPTGEGIAEQAALVQQIGAEAARGFDVEAHARTIRAQIEALISKGAGPKGAAPLQAETVLASPARNDSKSIENKPAEKKPGAVALPQPSPAPELVKETTLAIQRLRAALDELEGRLHSEHLR
jgi:hypothetical protein